ncbi:hypothetical protein ACFFLM_06490 [Deinococcus oregonensis]|uniref:HEAT repeat domain-containing protein n=1 Tax=Deinococcus oregonensis TaxID=1805970 RepID=A0ABV6AZM5_9DEIO
MVPNEWYGAARMMKAAGVDQFNLPERLESMDPAHREHLSRMYAPQQVMLEQHVEDLRFTEGFLRGRGWSAVLEEDLLLQLPLSAEGFRSFSLPPTQEVTDLRRLEHLRDNSPVAVTQQLAALARIRLGAPRNGTDAHRALEALHSPDTPLRDEAALTLGNWRFTAAHSFAAQPGELRDALLDVYRRRPEEQTAHAEAGLGLTLLSAQYANVQSVFISPETLVPLLASENPDLAFGAALALKQLDILSANLRLSERQYAAALVLAREGVVDPLVGVIPELEPHQQDRVLGLLRYTVGAVPALHDVLVSLLGQAEVQRVAAQLLLLEGRPEDMLRLIDTDPSLAQAVLENPILSSREVEQVCIRLLERGKFSLSGLSVLKELSESGKLSDSFVPDVFFRMDNAGQQELFSLARIQLGLRGDAILHRFLWTLVEGDLPELTRERAWGTLASWYGEYGKEMTFSAQGVQQFFGDLKTFLDRLCWVLEHPKLLIGFSSYHFLNVLHEVNNDVLAAVSAHTTEGFMQALWYLAQDADAYAPHRAASVLLLGQLTRSAEEGSIWRQRLSLFLDDQDLPSEVQRAVLMALYPKAQDRIALAASLRMTLENLTTYAERSGPANLLYQLEQLD